MAERVPTSRSASPVAVFKHRDDDPPNLWMEVEKMRSPGIRYVGAPTTGWKDPADAFHWSAFVPVPDEPGMVYRVSGWSRSRWAACAEAMHTYADRYVPGLGFLA